VRGEEMKVELIELTSVEALARAVAKPYRSKKSKELVRKVWKSNHRSIARHSNASFDVEGISVSLLTHISRHPHINLTVESSRYSSMSHKKPVVPPFILNSSELGEYVKDYNLIMDIVRKWENKEVLNEYQRKHTAKLFLTKNSTLDLIVSGNYQALYEFLQLRNCVRAEWEIRELGNKMSKILKEKMPVIFEDIGCRGDEWGICPEENSCGKYPSFTEI
jgi:thymidylate synthase (FAD)